MENLPPQLRAIAHTINPKVLAEIIRMETAKKSSSYGASAGAGGESLAGQQPLAAPTKRDAETVTDEVKIRTILKKRLHLASISRGRNSTLPAVEPNANSLHLLYLFDPRIGWNLSSKSV
jgi:hypothetical protein